MRRGYRPDAVPLEVRQLARQLAEAFWGAPDEPPRTAPDYEPARLRRRREGAA